MSEPTIPATPTTPPIIDWVGLRDINIALIRAYGAFQRVISAEHIAQNTAYTQLSPSYKVATHVAPVLFDLQMHIGDALAQHTHAGIAIENQPRILQGFINTLGGALTEQTYLTRISAPGSDLHMAATEALAQIRAVIEATETALGIAFFPAFPSQA